MATKYQEMCFIMAIGVLTCLLFLVAVRGKMIGSRIFLAQWDLNTVTVTDYSVEMKISEKGYRHWFEQVFHGPDGDYFKGISPGLSLKKHIID